MTGGVFSRTMITAFAVVMLVAPVSGKDSPQESDIANPHVAVSYTHLTLPTSDLV